MNKLGRLLQWLSSLVPSGIPQGVDYLAAVSQIIMVPLALLGIVIACLTFYVQLRQVRLEVSGVRNTVTRIEEQVERGRLRVVYPSENALVDVYEVVRGTTPYPERAHYIVVTPATGGTFIQEGSITPDVSGFWTGSAQFGTAELGRGEWYRIEVIATRTHLRPGRADIPHDAVRSVPVNVRRR